MTRADQFDIDGTADAAYAATRSIVAISNDATIDANQKADALQARTNLDQIVDRVLRHRSRERNLGNLVSLYQQLRKKKISYLGLSIATTMRQLKVIEGVDAPAGTVASTEGTIPANSVASPGKAGTIAVGSSGTDKSSRSIGTSATGAAVSTASYRQAIAEIAQLASEGKKTEVIARYEPLVSLEHDLARSLRTAQAPVIAAAEKAAASVTNFEDALAAMVDATTETAVERAVFYAQLLQYAGDPAFSTDSLSAQVDSLNLSLDNAERQINALADLTSGIESRPYVVVLSIDIDNDQVSINDTLRVSAVIQNLGTLSAEDVTATLRTDASATAITATDITFGLIGASEEQTASWSMQIVDTTRSSGTFQIELVSSNALTSSSLGSYSFTRPTSVGVESVPGELPSDLALFQSYPNPFNINTTFSFANPEHQRVTLTVYDVIGRQVAIVISETLPVGNFRVPFRADGLASGMYVVRLEAGNGASSGTIVVAR